MPDGTARTPISSTSAALRVLARHASVRATGELIAIGESVEVHLYLVAGRVAWGTTTADRFAFRKHLTNVLQIGETELQEALTEGRRTRRPLGETLVAWGVLTAGQLREGLKAQVLSALASLASCNVAQSLSFRAGQTTPATRPASPSRSTNCCLSSPRVMR